MSKGIEFIHIFVKTHRLEFTDSGRGGKFFCIGTPCGVCPIHAIRDGSSCKITESEFEELHETHPEHFI
jgi:hypothetical protein